MLKGILIVNNFTTSNKFKELYDMFLDSASKLDITLELKRSGEIKHNLDFIKDIKADFILFYDKDIILAKMFEECGFKVFNNSNAIENCDNKALTFIKLQKAGVNIPKTFVAPLTYENLGYSNLNFIDDIEKEISYPFVIKELRGSFGYQVSLVNNRQELEEKIRTFKARGFLVQEFISSSRGRDIRINVVGNKVISSMLRQSIDGDFRSNLTLGGVKEKYEATAEQCLEALKACKALEVDFAGVDVMFGENNKPIICEANSNAHFKTTFDCTGVDMSYEILKYIKGVLND